MNESLIHRIRGYVRIEVTGRHLERLVNRLTEKRMSVWDIRYLDKDRIEMYVTIPHFFRLRPLLKETGSRIRLRSKEGFPFWLARVEQRKFFAAGLLGFVIGIYLLSSLVWQVRVEGNEAISSETIKQAASNEGIRRMQWKFKLKEPSELAKSIQANVPGTAWVGVEIKGTHVIIKIVEAKIPEKPPLMNTRNLVASKSALVTEIFTEKGRPVVKPNTYVRKGDVLISGTLGDETNQQTVVAQGTVKGIVWYKPTVEVPLVQRYKVFTGESKERSYLVLGSRAVQITGYGKVPFEQIETITERHTLSWRTFTLPIGWLKETLREYDVHEQPIDEKEALTVGLEQAKLQILSEAGKDAKIVSEKILHEKTENGKVYMEVFLEVEEPIAVEQTIVP
ncbi:sporulation protein YqfD [Paenibacillus sp. YYML68]|uniref:sporulation protein YqfD n=1 Tax=Paenibacillus sp. YYML68 TaxID=2909250 RepID=UPI002490B2DA|nr:sporulation protein YqfD [Paenibacillus sp. YYML68]